MAALSPKTLFARIQRKLKALAPEGYVRFAKRVSARAGEAGALDLGADAEVLRFLARLGHLRSPRPGKAAAGRVRALVSEIASGANEPEVAAALALRTFASGAYGVLAEGVCGEVPRCDGCPLAGACAFRLKRNRGGVEPPEARLIKEGEDALSPAELLAAALGGRRDAAGRIARAARALEAAGGLRALGALSPEELAGRTGLSRAEAVRVKAALGRARQWTAARRAPGRAFACGEDFYEAYRARLADEKQEVFLVVLLDQRNRLLGDREVARGSLTGSLVHPREVFAEAIRASAAAVAFVHNHPSGDPDPSRDDLETTARLCEVAKLVGIRVLDHVVVGESSYISFVDEGLM